MIHPYFLKFDHATLTIDFSNAAQYCTKIDATKGVKDYKVFLAKETFEWKARKYETLQNKTYNNNNIVHDIEHKTGYHSI